MKFSLDIYVNICKFPEAAAATTIIMPRTPTPSRATVTRDTAARDTVPHPAATGPPPMAVATAAATATTVGNLLRSMTKRKLFCDLPFLFFTSFENL